MLTEMEMACSMNAFVLDIGSAVADRVKAIHPHQRYEDECGLARVLSLKFS